MTGLILFISALVILYILSRIFIQKLYHVLYRWLGDRDDAATALGWIFVPGTFIHEISHFLTALILLVPAGDMDIMPLADEHGIRLGKVSIAKTDFVRGSLIGLAPIISGAAIIIFSITYALPRLSTWWIILALIYIIFEISNTMFSSRKDLVAVLELLVFLIIVSGVLIYLKIFTPFIFIFNELISAGTFMQRISYFLFIPVGLESLFLFFFRKIRI